MGALPARWGVVSGGLSSYRPWDTPCMTAGALRHTPKGPFRRYQRSPKEGPNGASIWGILGYPAGQDPGVGSRIWRGWTEITSFSSEGSSSASRCRTYPPLEPLLGPLLGRPLAGWWLSHPPHEPISPYMAIEAIRRGSDGVVVGWYGGPKRGPQIEAVERLQGGYPTFIIS